MTNFVGPAKSSAVSTVDGAGNDKPLQPDNGQFHGRNVAPVSVNFAPNEHDVNTAVIGAAIGNSGKSVSSKKVNNKHRLESTTELSSALEKLGQQQKTLRMLIQSQYNENPKVYSDF